MCLSADIDGQGGLRLIYGIKGPGMWHREKRESKVDIDHPTLLILLLYCIKCLKGSTMASLWLCHVVVLSTHLLAWDSLSWWVPSYLMKTIFWFRDTELIGKLLKLNANCSGAYDEEESAARAYDLAALKYWGPSTFTNFPVWPWETNLKKRKNIVSEFGSTLILYQLLFRYQIMRRRLK